MIFHTYNRFRISDSSKDFSESYGESARFIKILEIDSESWNAAFISMIQKNHQESFRIACTYSSERSLNDGKYFFLNTERLVIVPEN